MPLTSIAKLACSFAVAATIWVVVGEGSIGDFIHSLLLGIGAVTAIWLIIKAVTTRRPFGSGFYLINEHYKNICAVRN